MLYFLELETRLVVLAARFLFRVIVYSLVLTRQRSVGSLSDQDFRCFFVGPLRHSG